MQHLKRVINKYSLILQRTTTILKLSPLLETSIQGSAVWPLIRSCETPMVQPLHSNLLSNIDGLRLNSPMLSSMIPSPVSSPSAHLAGKLRPGSAGLLRPVSAMSALSAKSNSTETNASTVRVPPHPLIPFPPHCMPSSVQPSRFEQAASAASSRPASAASIKVHPVRMMSPDVVTRLRFVLRAGCWHRASYQLLLADTLTESHCRRTKYLRLISTSSVCSIPLSPDPATPLLHRAAA